MEWLTDNKVPIGAPEEIQKTIVITSQDLNEALTFGDQIIVMDAGRIVQRGTPEAILLKPANDFVSDVVARLSPLYVMPGASCMTPLSALQKGCWDALSRRGRLCSPI